MDYDRIAGSEKKLYFDHLSNIDSEPFVLDPDHSYLDPDHIYLDPDLPGA